MKRPLNENIKMLRIQKGLNQVELAKALSVTKQCVSNWENDNVLPSVEMLIKIADYFGTTTDYLLGRTAKQELNVDGLSEEEVAHVSWLINDLKKK